MESNNISDNVKIAYVEEGLVNDLILKSILQLLPIQSLKVLRLVNSKWNHYALKQIQKINWENQNLITDCCEEYELEAYVDTFSNKPESLPYSCHEFGPMYETPSFHDPSSFGTYPALLRRFCHSFRRQIKGVDVYANYLQVPFQEMVEIFGEFLLELGIRATNSDGFPAYLKIGESKTLGNLPNLKSIFLDARAYRHRASEAQLSECNIFLKNVLSHMRPNSLREFKFHGWGRFDLAVEHLIQFNQVKSLKKLTIYPTHTFENGNLSTLQGGS